MRQVRRAHRPQAVEVEVVGLKGVDAVEVVEVVVGVCLCSYAVLRMRMSRVTSNSNTSNFY